MTWIDKYKSYWRIALLVLSLPAFIGPWGFDLLYVTEEFVEEACPRQLLSWNAVIVVTRFQGLQ